MAKLINKNGSVNVAGIKAVCESLGITQDQLLDIANGKKEAVAQAVKGIVGAGETKSEPKALEIVEHGWKKVDGKDAFKVIIKFKRRTVLYVWDGREVGPQYKAIRGPKLVQNARYTWEQIRFNAFNILLEAIEQMDLVDEIENKLGVDYTALKEKQEAIKAAAKANKVQADEEL